MNEIPLSKALSPGAPSEPIAIIGFSARCPGGANSVDLLWNKLINGEDMVGEWPVDRWDRRYFHPQQPAPGRVYTKAMGVLDGVAEFDADFFDMSPREASRVDPQQRILLELAWEALEDAGQSPPALAGTRTGVFIGISNPDYSGLQYSDAPTINAYTNAGAALSVAANRISYCFDFQGPSIAIDTACSSSLVAVHEACTALLIDGLPLAIAGGVNLVLRPEPSVGFCAASMLSPTGRCRAFAAAADGYVRAEGAAVLVLKRLTAAERDHDPIHGLIVASAVNSDGRTRGLSLPNLLAQERLLREVYRKAGLAPEQVDYIEAHGTGTPAGDPIECTAIGRVLGATRADEEKCLIGSIKSNIGHVESAAGVAGIVKVLLALRHRRIPGNLHFTAPNPRIDFDALRLEVVSTPRVLPDRAQPYRMGVNSFGFGGTNAHAVIEEYRDGRGAGSASAPLGVAGHVLVLSAKNEQALRARALQYTQLLSRPDGPSLAAICETALLRRCWLPSRLAVAGADKAAVAAALAAAASDGATARSAIVRAHDGEGRVPAFVFCGNGPQWPGMGRTLLQDVAAFRAAVIRVDQRFERLAGWSIAGAMCAVDFAPSMAPAEIAQPVLFAWQLGVAATLQEAGILPRVVIGHSVGEIAAAYVGGALSLDDAVDVIHARSMLQGRTHGRGRMAAIGISPELALELIAREPELDLAAINAPRSVTISGDPAALNRLASRLQDSGVFFKILDLNYAFHSRSMDQIRGDLLASLHHLSPRPAEIPIVSTVHESRIAGPELDAEYWWRNVRDPVRFAGGMLAALAEGASLLVEIGPRPVLQDYLRQIAQTTPRAVEVLHVLGLRRSSDGGDEAERLVSAICACYAHGAVAHPRRTGAPPSVPVRLPAYPWQRQRHWNGFPPSPAGAGSREAPEHPLLGRRLATPHPAWQNTLDLGTVGHLEDHVIQDAIVFPAACHLEMALAAARLTMGSGAIMIADFEIRKPFVVAEDASSETHFALADDGSFTIQSREGAAGAEAGTARAWTLHALGRIGSTAAAPSVVALASLRARMPRRVDSGGYYHRAAAGGVAFGPRYRAVSDVLVGENEALGTISAPVELRDEVPLYVVHPSILDGCLQILLACLIRDKDEGGPAAYLPTHVAALRLRAEPGEIRYCHVVVRRRGLQSTVADLTLLAEDGTVLGEVNGLRVKPFDPRLARIPKLYEFAWQLANTGGRPAPGSPFTRSLLAVAEAVAPEVQGLADRFGRKVFYRDIQTGLDSLAAAYALKGLIALGVTDQPFCADTLTESAGVRSGYEPLLSRLIAMAAAERLLTPAAPGKWRLADIALPDPRRQWRILFEAWPEYASELILLGRCGEQLAAVMQGRTDPSRLLSPNGGSAALDHLSDSAPSARLYNRTAAAVLRETLKDLPPGRILRILEIGAGTGGLTLNLLPLLPPDRSRYLFTDTTLETLEEAKQRFARYSFMEYATLNIEQEPVAQALPPHGFDLVLAANAIHRAGDIRRALGNVRLLLAPGGRVLLLEKHPERSADIIWGSLPGWFDAQDAERRQDGRLLAPPQWVEMLETAGFRTATLLSDAHIAAVNSRYAWPQHSVILSEQSEIRSPLNGVPGAASESSARNWLLLVDDEAEAQSIGSAVAGELQARGHGVKLLHLGGDDGRSPRKPARVGFGDAAGIRKLFEAWREQGWVCQEIAHLAGLRSQDPDASDAALDLQDARCLAALTLVQAIQPLDWLASPRLTLVTSGAFAPPTGGAQMRPGQAPLWGVGRTLRNEHPDLQPRLIDLHLTLTDPAAASRLVEEMIATEPEDEVLLTAEQRYVHRLRVQALTRPAAGAQPGQPAAKPDDAPLRRLDFHRQGSLDFLIQSESPRQPPGAGAVEIAVGAAGVNFKDLMAVLGMLPEDAFEHYAPGPVLGLECTGEILRVGAGVSTFRPGDRVICFEASSLATHVTAPTERTAKIPDGLSTEAAATIPVTFLTAAYGLEYLARLAQGERVLIHSAAGGVGLAAIQIAQLCGAEIFATAGTAERRDFLKLFGVAHVFDSRAATWTDDIMRATQGQGVDVVLNSLSGEAVWNNLQLLRPCGRLVEIGKRDIYAQQRLGLRPFRNNISYFGVDVSVLMAKRPSLAMQLLQGLLERFAAGKLRPLPYRVFPLEAGHEAFRLMRDSRHIGKLVLSMEHDPSPAAGRRVTPGLGVASDATYLISGGLGGFGLATAEWLVANGARHLVLIGRRGAATEEARASLAAMREKGAIVRAIAGDITDERTVLAALDGIRAEMPPLKGVIHAAMVLDDGAIANLDRQRLRRVLAPKIQGAWLLHKATQAHSLDFFVLYGSAASMVGNPGQASYAAANLYLEALARLRRQLGLPALTVAWGAIGEIGHVANQAGLQELIERRAGVKAIKPAHAFAALEELVHHDVAHAAIADVDWQPLRNDIPILRTPKFRSVLGEFEDEGGMQNLAEFQEMLLESDPKGRKELMVTRLKQLVSCVTRLPAADLDIDRPLPSYGVDSLMATELAVLIEQDVGKSVPILELVNESVSVMADRLLTAIQRAASSSWTRPQRADATFVEQPAMAASAAGVL